MKIIGPHLSVSKGLFTVQKQMNILKCETCGLFLKNQKRYDSIPLTKEDISRFVKEVKDPGILLPHGSYLINFANPEIFEKSYSCLVDDLNRCKMLGIAMYNIHPGSDVKKLGSETALKLISTNLNKVMEDVSEVIILIENMAGQGNVCGRTFEELRTIIEGVNDKERIGVTLDTCHMFAGGYDIRLPENFQKIMDEFDRVVGLKYLKALHLNDSATEFNSRKDRHECIGKGKIGVEAFRFIMNSPIFENIPMILETPNPEKYGNEILLLRGLEEKKNE